MLFFEVLLAFVDILLAILEGAIDDAREFVGGGGDRFRGAKACGKAALICTEIALAVPESLGGNA